MRAALLVAFHLAAGGAVAAQENRMWLADVELVGPVESAVFDCGSAGRVSLRVDLVAGERQAVRVPFPVRAPTGTEGLAHVPPPEIATVGAGTVIWGAWSAEQPGALEGVGPLLARGRPPVGSEEPRAGWGELGLLAGAFLIGFSLRRRWKAAGAIGLLGALALGAAGASGEHQEPAVTLIECDLAGSALRVVSARDAIELSAGRLEAGPGAVLEFELELVEGRCTGIARATGARLSTLESVAAPEIAPGANRFADLRAAWVRGPGGGWSAHGPWARGAPLPPEETGAVLPPPGWLKAGLPPGRGVLLGLREADRAWVRASGFGERD